MKLRIRYKHNEQQQERVIEAHRPVILGRPSDASLDAAPPASAMEEELIELPHVNPHWSRRHVRLEVVASCWQICLLRGQATYLVPPQQVGTKISVEDPGSQAVMLNKAQPFKLERPWVLRCDSSDVELIPEPPAAPVDRGATVPLPKIPPLRPMKLAARQETIDIGGPLNPPPPVDQPSPARALPVVNVEQQLAELGRLISLLDKEANQATLLTDTAQQDCDRVIEISKSLEGMEQTAQVALPRKELLDRVQQATSILAVANSKLALLGVAQKNASEQARIVKKHVGTAENLNAEIFQAALSGGPAFKESQTKAESLMSLVQGAARKANNASAKATEQKTQAEVAFKTAEQSLSKLKAVAKKQEQQEQAEQQRRALQKARMRNWGLLIGVLVLAMLLGVLGGTLPRFFGCSVTPPSMLGPLPSAASRIPDLLGPVCNSSAGGAACGGGGQPQHALKVAQPGASAV